MFDFDLTYSCYSMVNHSFLYRWTYENHVFAPNYVSNVGESWRLYAPKSLSQLPTSQLSQFHDPRQDPTVLALLTANIKATSLYSGGPRKYIHAMLGLEIILVWNNIAIR